MWIKHRTNTIGGLLFGLILLSSPRVAGRRPLLKDLSVWAARGPHPVQGQPAFQRFAQVAGRRSGS